MIVFLVPGDIRFGVALVDWLVKVLGEHEDNLDDRKIKSKYCEAEESESI